MELGINVKELGINIFTMNYRSVCFYDILAIEKFKRRSLQRLNKVNIISLVHRAFAVLQFAIPLHLSRS